MNRKSGAMPIGEIAQATVDLTNKEAWTRIESLLSQAGTARKARAQMKTKVWDERSRLRAARRTKA